MYDVIRIQNYCFIDTAKASACLYYPVFLLINNNLLGSRALNTSTSETSIQLCAQRVWRVTCFSCTLRIVLAFRNENVGV